MYEQGETIPAPGQKGMGTKGLCSGSRKCFDWARTSHSKQGRGRSGNWKGKDRSAGA